MKKGFVVIVFGNISEKYRKFFEEKPSKEEVDKLIETIEGAESAFIHECEYVTK